MNSSNTYRILAVDDLPDNLFLLQTVLKAEGFSVDVATSGRLALSKIKTSPPDLILLDVMMPDMDGYEVTRRIRQNDQFPSIPILLITAHSKSDALQGIELGANDFIRKPIDLDDLIARVKAFLQLEHTMDAAQTQQSFSQASKRL
jgi:two-component system sensor histidine kinase/response regulator